MRQVPQCLRTSSAQMPNFPGATQVSKCLSAKMAKCMNSQMSQVLK